MSDNFIVERFQKRFLHRAISVRKLNLLTELVGTVLNDPNLMLYSNSYSCFGSPTGLVPRTI